VGLAIELSKVILYIWKNKIAISSSLGVEVTDILAGFTLNCKVLNCCSSHG